MLGEPSTVCLQGGLRTKVVEYNLLFRAFVASAVEVRILAASKENTLNHGATTLELSSSPLESGCFGGRHNRDGGVRARVYERLIEKRDSSSCVSPNLAAFFRRFPESNWSRRVILKSIPGTSKAEPRGVLSSSHLPDLRCLGC